VLALVAIKVNGRAAIAPATVAVTMTRRMFISDEASLLTGLMSKS
jgi:hypothetical protein